LSEKGLVPIVDKFLHKNYLFALEFQEGLVFGRVVRRRPCQWRPYKLIDVNGTAVTISAATAQAELQFRDSRNTQNDILYLSQSSNSGYPWLLYGSFGLKPQYINAYPRFPAGKDLSGRFPNVDPIRPSAGDDTGYLNSLNSPYDEPSDWLEIVIPPGQHLSVEYYNKDAARAYQPVLNLQFCVYWFQPLTPPRFSRLISMIALRQVPAALLTVGFGDVPLDFGSVLTKDWNATPLPLDQAIGLAGPGGS
jgi:hypothetical protein